MLKAISAPRGELRGHAPRISTIKINPEFIGMVIGKGGETIRGLEADYDVQIDIEEDGTILVYATEGDKAEAAMNAINDLTKEPEVGDTYTGKVVKTTQFGAFVELKKGTDGLLHVSQRWPRQGRPHRRRDQPRRRPRRDRPGGRQDRGRIGLKLVAKHEDGSLVQPRSSSSAKDAPERPREERPPRRDGGNREVAAEVAATAAADANRLGRNHVAEVEELPHELDAGRLEPVAVDTELGGRVGQDLVERLGRA